MNPNEYQQLASRTECDQTKSLNRMASFEPGGGVYSRELLMPIRVNHSIIGLAGEVGELASAFQKWIYYGRDLDRTNVIEEYGDLLWYIALGLNALGVDMEYVMTANIAKLKARFPEKYSDHNAAEENRDRAKEMEALKTVYQGLKPSGLPPVRPDDTLITKPHLNARDTVETFEGKVCEVCGVPATRVCHDSDRDFTYEEHHYFCKTHDRPTAILPTKPK